MTGRPASPGEGKPVIAGSGPDAEVRHLAGGLVAEPPGTR
jgi:hypothetical protein